MPDRTGRPSRSARDLPPRVRPCLATEQHLLLQLGGPQGHPEPALVVQGMPLCLPNTVGRDHPAAHAHLADAGGRLYALGVSHWVPGHGAWSPGGGVGPDTLWQDGQRVAAWLTRRLQTWCPPVVLVDETWFPIGGARRLVAVVMDPMGHRLEMRVAGLSTGRPDSPTGNGAVWHSW